MTARISALELALEGKLVNLPADTLLGRDAGTGTVEQISQSRFATPAQIDQAIIDLVGGAPGALNTLIELAAALNNDNNFATTITNELTTKVDTTTNQIIDGSKLFLKPINIPYLERDITVKIITGINWIANNWYVIPGLTIPFGIGEIQSYLLSANYQFNDGTNTYSHWQAGGSCLLPGGIGWKNGGSRSEIVMQVQQHNGDDALFTFRSEWGAGRGLEIKPNFDIAINGLGFIEFTLKRL